MAQKCVQYTVNEVTPTTLWKTTSVQSTGTTTLSAGTAVQPSVGSYQPVYQSTPKRNLISHSGGTSLQVNTYTTPVYSQTLPTLFSGGPGVNSTVRGSQPQHGVLNFGNQGVGVNYTAANGINQATGIVSGHPSVYGYLPQQMCVGGPQVTTTPLVRQGVPSQPVIQGPGFQQPVQQASMPNFNMTSSHQIKNVPVFTGGPDCKVLIDDWIRDTQYLLNAGAMPPNLQFLTIVRNLSGEARKLVLNLPVPEQTAERAFEELRAEYGDLHCPLDPMAEFYSRMQLPNESACSYAIALEAVLRSIEERKHGGQQLPDRDYRLTHQFMRGLHDEGIYNRLDPMQPWRMTYKDLRDQLRRMAHEKQRTKTDVGRMKKASTQPVVLQECDVIKSNKSTKQSVAQSDLTELTELVKQIAKSQEAQANRVSGLEEKLVNLTSTDRANRKDNSAQSSRNKGPIKCFKCGQEGHVSSGCRMKLSGSTESSTKPALNE